ncbi:rhombosortase [Nibricoccus sp. IMCC34717]|uniref:rhombosortase n=1 Tax=Nibricoccus sp. IMCC34717 TaxID=3034021 RepID=UPI00384C2B5D
MNPFPYLTLGGATLALAAFRFPNLASLLEWSRPALESGEWWRLLTGHFAHFTPAHLLWDLSLFLILGLWVERRSRRAWLGAVLVGGVSISLAVWFGLPGMQAYRGLSGVDSALFAWIAFDLARLGWKARRWSALWLGGGALAALVGKAGYESVTGLLLFVDPGASFIPVPLAHAVGGLCGMAVARCRRADGGNPEALRWRPT